MVFMVLKIPCAFFFYGYKSDFLFYTVLSFFNKMFLKLR